MKKKLDVYVTQEVVRNQIVQIEIEVDEDDTELERISPEEVEQLASEEIRPDKWDETIKDWSARVIEYKKP